jgi:hypothetical protein
VELGPVDQVGGSRVRQQALHSRYRLAGGTQPCRVSGDAPVAKGERGYDQVAGRDGPHICPNFFDDAYELDRSAPGHAVSHRGSTEV